MAIEKRPLARSFLGALSFSFEEIDGGRET
jgi:hypothetical protein